MVFDLKKNCGTAASNNQLLSTGNLEADCAALVSIQSSLRQPSDWESEIRAGKKPKD
jgi:hypothetical protein